MINRTAINLWDAKCCIAAAHDTRMGCNVADMLAMREDVETMLFQLMELKTVILNVEKENPAETVAEAYKAVATKAQAAKDKANSRQAQARVGRIQAAA
jgi:hypothetical protein